MTFLLDENFPLSAAVFLRDRGHVALTVSETCGLGAPDEVVFAEAQQRGAVLVTSDRDFYHTIPLLHPEHSGILVIAFRQPNRSAIMARLGWFLDNISLPIVNKVYLLRDQTYRFISPPGEA